MCLLSGASTQYACCASAASTATHMQRNQNITPPSTQKTVTKLHLETKNCYSTSAETIRDRDRELTWIPATMAMRKSMAARLANTEIITELKQLRDSPRRPKASLLLTHIGAHILLSPNIARTKSSSDHCKFTKTLSKTIKVTPILASLLLVVHGGIRMPSSNRLFHQQPPTSANELKPKCHRRE